MSVPALQALVPDGATDNSKTFRTLFAELEREGIAGRGLDGHDLRPLRGYQRRRDEGLGRQGVGRQGWGQLEYGTSIAAPYRRNL